MKQFIPFIILFVFLVFLTGANYYIGRRIGYYFNLTNARLTYSILAAISVFMLAGIALFTNATSSFANVSYTAASLLMGFMLYLLLSVITVDVASVFIKVQPKFLGMAAVLLTVAVTGFGVWNALNKRITNVNIELAELKSEMRAVLLTDIHIGHFWGAKTLQNIVNLTNEQKPDLVFISGDLFDGKIRLNEKSLAPLKNLEAPVYFVEGNHDGYSGVEEIKQQLRAIGVNVLENEVTHFGELQLVGLNHMLADNNTRDMHASSGRSTIQTTLDSLNIFNGKPTILLHHSPDGVEYANKHGIDLLLAGHTHAGQLFPFTLITKAMFDFNKGLHNFNGTQVYTSQGVGTFGPPMRVGTISEISVLNLIPGK